MRIATLRHRGTPLIVVIVAAGALILAGCSGDGTSSKPVRTTSTGRTNTAPNSTPLVRSSTSTVATAVPAGGPVPSGFRAQSATFVSSDQGWVLGSAPCATAPCTAVVRTSDDGGSWAGIPAPTDGLENPRSGSTVPTGVSEIRFADNLNGWVFGPDLWSTHDGGEMWSHTTSGPGAQRVVDLESSGGFVYVATEQCTVQESSCPGELWRSSDATDAFQKVATFNLAPEVGYTGSILAIHDTTGYVVIAATVGAIGAPALYVTANGTTWSPEPNPCPADLGEISVAPVDTVRAAMLCSGQGAAGSSTKEVLATSDGGHSWVPEGSAPPSGDGGALSAASVSTLAIATSSAATQIYRSVNGGTTWSTPLSLNDGGEGWGDFGFTDSTHGFAVHAPIGRYQPASAGATPADTGTFFVTTDGGATWSTVAF